jgi:hypothetical protein
MINKKPIVIISLLSCLISFSSSAQFKYVNVGITQSRMKIYGENFSRFNSKINVTEFHVGGLWRFNRVIGAGLDFGIPMFQKSTHTFRNSETTNKYANGEDEFFYEYTETRYKPQLFDYTFKQSMKIGLIGRIYVGGTSNVFFDIKVSSLKIKEDFDFERLAKPAITSGTTDNNRPALKAVNIHENHEYAMIVPGIAFGWQPHIGKQFFMDFNIACDFYKFKSSSFSYEIPYNYFSGWETSYEDNVTIKGQLVDNKRAFTANVRFGMYF